MSSTDIKKAEKLIKDFSKCYEKSENPWIIKVHVMTNHLMYFIKKKKTGLSKYGEDKVEASHQLLSTVIVHFKAWTPIFGLYSVEQFI